MSAAACTKTDGCRTDSVQPIAGLDRRAGKLATLSPASPAGVDTNKLDVVTAQRVVDRLVAGWRNAPNSVTVATDADLPALALEELAQQGEKTAKGVFHGGTFYLVADQHTSPAEVFDRISSSERRMIGNAKIFSCSKSSLITE